MSRLSTFTFVLVASLTSAGLAGEWSKTATLYPSDGAELWGFGGSVAIGGAYAVVGAPGKSQTPVFTAGGAYVLRREVTGQWTEVDQLAPVNATVGMGFASAVAMDGTRIAVGVPGDDNNCGTMGCDYGAVMIFEETGPEDWSLTAVLREPVGDQQKMEFFGAAVALVGDTLVVTADDDDELGFSAGAAYVYEHTIPGGWQLRQKLLGSDTAASDHFGWSVAYDGQTIVVGAVGTAGAIAGRAYVFEFIGGSWVETVKLQPADGFQGNQFGRDVAVRGDLIAVGASNDDDLGPGAGAIYLYQRSAGVWTQHAKLYSTATAPSFFGEVVDLEDGRLCASAIVDSVCFVFEPVNGVWTQQHVIDAGTEASSEGFGRALALRGDALLVGARETDGDETVNLMGSVISFIHDYDGPPAPNCDLIQAKLSASTGTEGDRFGVSTAIDGTRAAVGADAWDGGAGIPHRGAVFVYDQVGGSWTESATLVASDPAHLVGFGFSVGLDGDTVAVGAPAEDSLASNAGAVYLFERSGGAWQQTAKLHAPDGTSNDSLGRSIDLQGDVLLASAPFDGGGSVYVFQCSGSAWTFTQKLTASDNSNGDAFGYSVAFDGDVAVIGAWTDDAPSFNSGAAYVFERIGGTWTQVVKLTPTGVADNDRFGSAVAVEGPTVVVGARLDDHDALGHSNSGSVSVYRKTAGAWQLESKLTPIDAAAQDLFGDAVAVDADSILVGAPQDDDDGYSSGSAYFFRRKAGGWTQVAKVRPDDGEEFEFFGRSLALSSNLALIGAPEDDDAGFVSGSARVVADPGPVPAPHLVFDPPVVQTGDYLRWTACQGGVGDPVALFVVSANGAPLIQPLPLIGSFDLQGVWTAFAQLPPLTGTVTIGFRAYTQNAMGWVIGSNEAPVLFQ